MHTLHGAQLANPGLVPIVAPDGNLSGAGVRIDMSRVCRDGMTLAHALHSDGRTGCYVCSQVAFLAPGAEAAGQRS